MILLDNEQEDSSEQLGPMLWKPLTSRNTRQSSNCEQADKEDDIEMINLKGFTGVFLIFSNCDI